MLPSTEHAQDDQSQRGHGDTNDRQSDADRSADDRHQEHRCGGGDALSATFGVKDCAGSDEPDAGDDRVKSSGGIAATRPDDQEPADADRGRCRDCDQGVGTHSDAFAGPSSFVSDDPAEYASNQCLKAYRQLLNRTCRKKV